MPFLNTILAIVSKNESFLSFIFTFFFWFDIRYASSKISWTQKRERIMETRYRGNIHNR
jgi:hypothetical protein